jgi:hypothetical protein
MGLGGASSHIVQRRHRAKESTSGALDRVNRASRAAPIAIQLCGDQAATCGRSTGQSEAI